MNDSETTRLVTALADPATRREASEQLAAHLGADAVCILVHDPDVDAFVPAPGYPTLPGGPAWRAFLGAARQHERHSGIVGYPTAGDRALAQSCRLPGLLLVFVGGSCDAAGIDAVVALGPLLAAMLQAEHVAFAARGELRAAQSHARQAEALARALDGSRSEVERALRQLERQARELHIAQARVEDAMRAKDEFLAMLGHELRNPLSPILTALQLMRLRNQSSREQDVIERQVASLKRLVDDLLDVSRITGGKIELCSERVEIAEVAARAIELSSPVLESKRQVLDVGIPARGLVVDGDPSRLAQVFANLLTNAAKYSDTESTVLFEAERHEASVRVRVRDQGIGMKPEMLDRVFEAFVQNRQGLERSQGGLGLGLAIVRSLVALHGGTVRAHSDGEGLGSEFIVELPSAADAGDAAAHGRMPSSTDRHAVGRQHERVLVVDDNEDAATMLADALQALGFAVRTARDGPSALSVAASFRPHVALLDIGLPVMDGYELADRLRTPRNTPVPRLVAITGYGQAADTRRSLDAGFEAHLVKPIALEQLQEVFAAMRSADA